MSDEKLSKQVPLRLPLEINVRVEAVARRRGMKRPAWIREAIHAALVRDEAAAPVLLTAEQVALLDLCQAAAQRGVDPREALTAALEQKLTAEAEAPAVPA